MTPKAVIVQKQKDKFAKGEVIFREGDTGAAMYIIKSGKVEVVKQTGDEEVVGKSLGTDLDKGKLTLPVILLLRALPEAKRGELRDLLASPNGADDRRTRVVRMLEEHGVVEAAMRRAHDFVEEGRAALQIVGESDLTENLGALLEYSLQRRR